MIGGIHIGRIEPGDHRIKARLLLLRQCFVGHGNVCVGERVVVEKSVGLQVVAWGEAAGILVGPLLLERGAEESDAPDLCVHDFEKVVDVGSLLNVIGQVEVCIVELIWCSLGSSRLRLGGKLNRPEKEKGSDEQDTCEVSVQPRRMPAIRRWQCCLPNTIASTQTRLNRLMSTQNNAPSA